MDSPCVPQNAQPGGVGGVGGGPYLSIPLVNAGMLETGTLMTCAASRDTHQPVAPFWAGNKRFPLGKASFWA